MAAQYYVLYLDDPASPSFCSSRKMYVGTLDSISKVIEAMRTKSQYSHTIAAYDGFLMGDKNAEHYVAYAPCQFLTPIKVIHSTSFEMGPHTWEHTNTWEYSYQMRFESAAIYQLLFEHDGMYRRCLRAAIKDFCYAGIRGWRRLDGGFWGNSTLLDIQQLPDSHFVFSNMLYVEEDTAADCNDLVLLMSDPQKVVFDKICDEIFGDG